MTEVFELGGDLVRPEVANNVMRLIAEGAGEDDDADAKLRSVPPLPSFPPLSFAHFSVLVLVAAAAAAAGCLWWRPSSSSWTSPTCLTF